MADPVTMATLSQVATIFGAGVGGISAINSMTSGGKDKPEMAAAPTVEKPTEMPTPNDAAVAAARRKSIAGLVARQGRASTILTDQSSGGATLGA